MIAPPRSPSPVEIEALIKEARERQLRRRLVAAAGIAVAAALGLGVYAVAIGGTEQTDRGSGGRPRPADPAAAALSDRRLLPGGAPVGDDRRLPGRRQAHPGHVPARVALERDVAVLAAGAGLRLRLRRLERIDQDRTGPPRLDHVVDVTALGRAVRARELLLVIR